MNIRKYGAILGVAAALLLVSGVWFFAGKKGENFSPRLNLASFFSSIVDSGEDSVSVESPIKEEGSHFSYTHPVYKYSFFYPKGFIASPMKYSEDSETLVVEKGDRQGFQIFAAPFEEENALTAERIAQDLPDLVMKNAVKVTFGGNNIQGVAFSSHDEEVGDTYEVWFTYGGNLYQVMAYKEFEKGLQDILATFKFE
ncbi:hypothetical protein HYT01_01175 [Candidatus Giovannonibacteria bacterium]|nr:hypothetical protein [Candidatus Giovannonibacteria bacterium]